MNLLEKSFFSVFLLFSKWKGYEEFTGLNALIAFGLALFLNIATILLLGFAAGVEIELINLLNTRIKWITVSLFWFLILALFLLKRNQLKKYRERLIEIDEAESKRIRFVALAYCLGSIIVGFTLAFVTNYFMNPS